MKSALENNVINVASTSSSGTNLRNQLTKTFSKITVQSVLSENNANSLNISNNNAIVRKIKDFGMLGSLSKRPLAESKSSILEKSEVSLAKKPKLNKDTNSTPKSTKKQKNVNPGSNSNTPGTKPAGTPGRKGLPLPQAVARRNARERNRVKQVNNGFAALRERIPEEVAEAFEAHGNGRASAKKLSKVETLRMAVEYIRSLERLLGFEFPLNEHNMLGSSCAGSTSGSDSNLQFSPEAADQEHDFSLIKDEFDALSPSLEEQFEDSLSNYDVDEYFTNSSGNNSDFLEPVAYKEAESPTMLPNITTLNGLQYIRIPGTNTYQLFTDELFVDNSITSSFKSMEEEQINTLIGTKCSGTNAAEMNLIAVSTGQQTTPVSTLTCNGTSMTNATTAANGAFIEQRQSSTLSRSPVPVPVPQRESSPNAKQQQQQQDQAQVVEQRGKCLQPAVISPAANELLLQTCATATTQRLGNNNGVDPAYIAPMQSHQQQQQQQQLTGNVIKQEFNDSGEYISTESMHSPAANTTIIYQSANMKPQQAHLLLNQTTCSISPPLENNSGAILSTFFPLQNQNNGATCFQRIIPIKALANTLSDDGMIDALEWWDAHTPKSDNGSTNI